MKGPSSHTVLPLAHSCCRPRGLESVRLFLASGLQVRSSTGRVLSCFTVGKDCNSLAVTGRG